ncbi:MAG: MBL fold metallo-hydrolase [Pseudomonadota bacterium]
MPTIATHRSRGAGSPDVIGIYEPDTGSVQYVVSCPDTQCCALIDVVLNFEPQSARVTTDAMDAVLALVAEKKLTVAWILDTHPHADHVMASSALKATLGAPNAIGEKVREIAALWREIYNAPDAFDPDQDFDRLFADGDTFEIGNLPVRVMLSPGHTLGSISFVIGSDAAFIHDTFMQPDVGTSRCDFPGGSSSDLYDSLEAILALPDETRLFIGHDYGTDTRNEPTWASTVAEQRAANKHIGGRVSKTDFMAVRDARDAKLKLPDRMLTALQMNLRAGRLPDVEDDGHAYLKIPLDRF